MGLGFIVNMMYCLFHFTFYAIDIFRSCKNNSRPCSSTRTPFMTNHHTTCHLPTSDLCHRTTTCTVDWPQWLSTCKKPLPLTNPSCCKLEIISFNIATVLPG